MKKSNIILMILVFSVGCSKPKDYPTLFGRLEKKSTQDNKLIERTLAADTTGVPNRCLIDIFNVELVRAEVVELEKRYNSGPKVTGQWRHLNLADLPIPQANFLKRFGARLGDQKNTDAIDYSSCQDVPCIYNKIYGKENDPAGYVHYLWYLKMGNMLAATNRLDDNEIGVYNGKQIPISAYLYRDNEIYAFWRLLHMMKAPHTELVGFNEIYRVPQNNRFDFEQKLIDSGHGRIGETCGLAYSSGVVVLQDKCLTLTAGGDGGEFYQSVLHEITHQLDYFIGRQIGKMYYSDVPGKRDETGALIEPSYLDLSGFESVEEVKDGHVVRKWAQKPGIKLITNYAGTSPAENFAESIAGFRVTADRAAYSMDPDHYNFISKNYFFGKNFERKTLINNWLAERGASIAQNVFKAIGSCSTSIKPVASTFFKKTDFEVPVLTAMMNCLGTKASDMTVEIAANIKVTDPDGCTNINGSYIASTFNPALKTVILGHMNKYLKELQKDKTYFAKVQGFIDQIPSTDISVSAYLSCVDFEKEAICYEAEATRLVLEQLAPLNLPAEHSQDLATMYLTSHNIEETRTYFKTYYSTFVKSNLDKIGLHAEDLFTKCLSLPLSDSEAPKGTFFSTNGQYMASSIYNCINADLPDVAKEIVRTLAVDEMTVQHPKEEILLYNDVVPQLQQELSEIFKKQKAIEDEALAKYIEAEEESVRPSILADLGWIKNFYDSAGTTKDCKELAMSKIDYPLRFQTKSESFKTYSEDVCRDLQKSPEYQALLSTSQAQLEQKTIIDLEELMLAQGRIRAKQCSAAYPIEKFLDKLRNASAWKDCLAQNWDDAITVTANQFGRDPLVMKFKYDREVIIKKLESDRLRYQIRTKKEFGFN